MSRMKMPHLSIEHKIENGHRWSTDESRSERDIGIYVTSHHPSSPGIRPRKLHSTKRGTTSIPEGSV
jgi:hypothetical protein